MKTCYIIAAGDAEKIEIKYENNDIIIACDAGLTHCEINNIEPDIVIGDFDSLGYIPNNKKTIILPVKKDDTDTFFAVKYAMEKGYNRFVIFGGAGGKRPEHTYANIAVLAYISKNGGQAFLDCDNYSITTVTNGFITFNSNMSGNVSVFSFDTHSRGVNETGLLYSVDNIEIENSSVLGVSNSFTGQKSRIGVKNGTIVIYFDGKFSDVTIDKYINDDIIKTLKNE